MRCVFCCWLMYVMLCCWRFTYWSGVMLVGGCVLVGCLLIAHYVRLFIVGWMMLVIDELVDSGLLIY